MYLNEDSLIKFNSYQHNKQINRVITNEHEIMAHAILIKLNNQINN